MADWVLYVFTALSLICVIAAVVLLILRRLKKFNCSIIGFFMLLFASIWFVRFPVGYFCISNSGLAWYEELFNSLVHTLQSFSMDEDYTQYILNGKNMAEYVASAVFNLNDGMGATIADGFGIYTALLNTIAPICGGGILLSILQDIIPQIKLWINERKFWCKKYYFSELNERTLTCAKSIVEKCDNKAVIIFTDVYTDRANEKSSELLQNAKAIGAICINDDITRIYKHRANKKELLLMDDDELDNIKTLADLADEKHCKALKNVTVRIFYQDDSYALSENKICSQISKYYTETVAAEHFGLKRNTKGKADHGKHPVVKFPELEFDSNYFDQLHNIVKCINNIAYSKYQYTDKAVDLFVKPSFKFKADGYDDGVTYNEITQSSVAEFLSATKEALDNIGSYVYEGKKVIKDNSSNSDLFEKALKIRKKANDYADNAAIVKTKKENNATDIIAELSAISGRFLEIVKCTNKLIIDVRNGVYKSKDYYDAFNVIADSLAKINKCTIKVNSIVLDKHTDAGAAYSKPKKHKHNRINNDLHNAKALCKKLKHLKAKRILKDLGLNIKDDTLLQYAKQAIADEYSKAENRMVARYAEAVEPRICRTRCYQNMIWDMLLKYPLYEPLLDRKKPKDLNVTILGNGNVGMEMMLSTTWCGQLLDIPLCINMVSKDSEADACAKINRINTDILESTKAQSPMLKIYKDREDLADPYFTFRYNQADISCADIENMECHVPELYNDTNISAYRIIDSDYFFIALGSDEANIKTAEDLYLKIAARQNKAKDSRHGVNIVYVVYDSNLCEALNKGNYESRSNTISIKAVGSLTDVYNYENVIRFAEGKSKLVLDSVEMSKKHDKKASVDVKSIKKRHGDKIYEYMSAIAQSLHYVYKQYSVFVLQSEITDWNVWMQKTSSCICTTKQEKLAQSLGWLEKRRWNAYLRTLGFKWGENKNVYLKLHNCLIECKKYNAESNADDLLDDLLIFDPLYKVYDLDTVTKRKA